VTMKTWVRGHSNGKSGKLRPPRDHSGDFWVAMLWASGAASAVRQEVVIDFDAARLAADAIAHPEGCDVGCGAWRESDEP
jgi:hypothetical protein